MRFNAKVTSRYSLSGERKKAYKKLGYRSDVRKIAE